MPFPSTKTGTHRAGDWTLDTAASPALWSLRGDDPLAADRSGRKPRVNQAVEVENGTLLRLGPDAWLFAAASPAHDNAWPRPPTWIAENTYALDVSGAWCVLRVHGRGAARIVAQGCALDPDTTAFPVGGCARTRFARVALVLHRTRESAFTLYCPRSDAGYLRQVLCNEFRPPGC